MSYIPMLAYLQSFALGYMTELEFWKCGILGVFSVTMLGFVFNPGNLTFGLLALLVLFPIALPLVVAIAFGLHYALAYTGRWARERGES